MGPLEAEHARIRKGNRQLREENARLRGEIEGLAEENTRLEQQLAAARKDSSTSSKAPSSDVVKPKTPLRKRGKKRKWGEQPGNEQHSRSPLLPEAVNVFVRYTLDRFPGCGDRGGSNVFRGGQRTLASFPRLPTMGTSFRGCTPRSKTRSVPSRK